MASATNGSVRPSSEQSTPLSSRHSTTINGHICSRVPALSTRKLPEGHSTAYDNSYQQEPKHNQKLGEDQENSSVTDGGAYPKSFALTAQSRRPKSILQLQADPSSTSNHFDPRIHNSPLRKRQAHDAVTSVCMLVFVPTAIVIFLVYLVMLCRYYSCVRNTLKLVAALLEAVVWSRPMRMFSELAGIPVALGIAVSMYYLVIFYFNSDVPGVRPPLPHISWKTGIRADPNYSFGLLLGFICLVFYSIPDILLFHSARIYNSG